MQTAYSLSDIDNAAQMVLQKRTSQIVAFQGVMGVGKTTLIKAICKKLNVKETVSSPTFSLVNTYQGSTGAIYHFDFYRLKHFNEALDFGVEEYFESGNLCLLEWAEKITPLLPHSYNTFAIAEQDDFTRIISLINDVQL